MVQPCHYKIRGPKKVCGTLRPPMDSSQNLWCAIVLYHTVAQRIPRGKALAFFGALDGIGKNNDNKGHRKAKRWNSSIL